jgi:hypothetical protein
MAVLGGGAVSYEQGAPVLDEVTDLDRLHSGSFGAGRQRENQLWGYHSTASAGLYLLVVDVL